MILNEAPERHPQLPVGFPTCGNYDIGADGYEEAVDKAKTPNKSGKGISIMYTAVVLVAATQYIDGFWESNPRNCNVSN